MATHPSCIDRAPDKGRRSFFKRATSVAALAVIPALPACTVTTSNGATTITLDVDEVVQDGSVALAVIKTALGFVGIPAGIVAIVDDALSLVSTGMSAFQSSAGSSLTLTFDSSSVPAAFTSLIADLQTASANIAAVAKSEGSALSSALAGKIASVASDVSNVASILESIVSAVASAVPYETAAQARAGQIAAIRTRHGV